MPASTRSWSTSFCAWTTLLLLHIFPDIAFSRKTQQESPNLGSISFFNTETCSRKMMYFTRWPPNSQLRLCRSVWSVWARSWLYFLTCTPFLFTIGGSSKALWYKRSYNTVLEMSETSHITSQPPLMKRLLAKALCCASGMLFVFLMYYIRVYFLQNVQLTWPKKKK